MSGTSGRAQIASTTRGDTPPGEIRDTTRDDRADQPTQARGGDQRARAACTTAAGCRASRRDHPDDPEAQAEEEPRSDEERQRTGKRLPEKRDGDQAGRDRRGARASRTGSPQHRRASRRRAWRASSRTGRGRPAPTSCRDRRGWTEAAERAMPPQCRSRRRVPAGREARDRSVSCHSGSSSPTDK